MKSFCQAIAGVTDRVIGRFSKVFAQNAAGVPVPVAADDDCLFLSGLSYPVQPIPAGKTRPAAAEVFPEEKTDPMRDMYNYGP